MTRRWLTVAIAVGALAATPAVRAADRYEGGVITPFPGQDDSNASNNTMSHGATQDHDLDQQGGGTEDQDWMVVPTQARHSYEARLYGSNHDFSFGACAACPHFERVDTAGTVVQNDAGFANQGNYFRTIRWTATNTDGGGSTTGGANTTYIRVTGGTGSTEDASFVYTVQMWDTTLAVARWNNAGGQITVFLITNTGPVAATGNIDFYNAAGALLATQAFSIPVNGDFSVNTGTIGALAGLAGHAYVSHNAGYGGLSGKAVALEPSTGFSFDTPMESLPH